MKILILLTIASIKSLNVYLQIEFVNNNESLIYITFDKELTDDSLIYI